LTAVKRIGSVNPMDVQIIHLTHNLTCGRCRTAAEKAAKYLMEHSGPDQKYAASATEASSEDTLFGDYLIETRGHDAVVAVLPVGFVVQDSMLNAVVVNPKQFADLVNGKSITLTP